MVADIQLLQGKIIDDPEKRVPQIAGLIEALAFELVRLQEHSQSDEGVHARVKQDHELPERGSA